MTIITTPEERFEDLPGFDHEPQRVAVDDDLEMAYVDVAGDGPETFLLLHGEPTWSFLYRKMIPTLAERGRVVAPDYIGFGRSDKFADRQDYSYDMFLRTTQRFVEKLDLTDATLVGQDWGGLVGLRTAAVDMPDRFARIVAANTMFADGTQEMPQEWLDFASFVEEQAPDLPIGFLVDGGCYHDLDDDVWAAYEAPFPTPEHKAGAVEFPFLVPRDPDDPGAESQRETKEALKAWEKPFFTAFAEGDPIMRDAMPVLRKMVPTADREPETWIPEAGHFIQEDAGEVLAREIVDFVDRRPLP